MKLLRTMLYAQAGTWLLSGLALATVPGVVVRDVFDDRAIHDWGLIRILGIAAVGLAMLMVLVAQRLDDIWWWSWAFILTAAGVATASGLHAVFGPLAGRAELMYWLIAAVNALLAAVLLVGMGRTAQDKPFT